MTVPQDMRADIFTKFYPESKSQIWIHNCELIAHIFPEKQWNELSTNSLPKKKKSIEPVETDKVDKKSKSSKKGKAAPAATTESYDRVIIEFCCGENSRIGQPTKHSKGCKVIRITKEHDLTTKSGLEFTVKAIKGELKKISGKRITLWVSIPCTGGSPWQNINQRYEHARKMISRNTLEYSIEFGRTSK